MGERPVELMETARINGSPDIIAIVMAFVGDICISRRCAGVPKIYPFLVIDPDYRDEYALVREEQWRAWADKAEEDHADFNNGPCETCGLLKLNLYVAYVGFIHLALHRERAYLRNTDSVSEWRGTSYERRHICDPCFMQLCVSPESGGPVVTWDVWSPVWSSPTTP